MKNMKIRKKFIILSFIVYISLFFLGSLALKINQDSFSNLNKVVKSFKETQVIQTSYIEDLFTLREITLSLLISKNDDYKKNMNKIISPMIEELDKELLSDPLISEEIWQEYKKIVLKIKEYSKKGFEEEAFINISTVERNNFYILINRLKEIQNNKLKDSEEKLKKLQENVFLNNYYIVFGFIFIGILGILLDITIIRVIIKQIENLESGVKEFLKYLTNPLDYKENLHIDVNSYDELGLLSNAINKKVKVIKENLDEDYKLIEEATLTLEHLKQGKLGNRLEEVAKSKELNVLKNVMNEMIINLEKKVKEEILQRTNNEKLLIQQSKLAAMGEMIENIAHQWRQPLGEINAVLMELQTIATYGKLEKEYLLESIKTCNKITEHMSNTISDFQSFFKPTKNKIDFSVLDACKKAISIIDASLKNNNIDLVFDIKDDNIINGYPNEFSHAILNIISNAKDVLVLRKISNPKIILSIKVGKRFTIIKIEDNAGGIHLENIDSVFEPYFTTKHTKRGTGIGLYMTKMIIENNMHGFVKVLNTTYGALFTIKVE